LSFFAGALLLLVTFFVFLHWFAYAPAALVETGSVPRAFEASRDFARERRTYGFTAPIVLVWTALFVIATFLSGPDTRAVRSGGGAVPHDEVSGVRHAHSIRGRDRRVGRREVPDVRPRRAGLGLGRRGRFVLAPRAFASRLVVERRELRVPLVVRLRKLQADL